LVVTRFARRQQRLQPDPIFGPHEYQALDYKCPHDEDDPPENHHDLTAAIEEFPNRVENLVQHLWDCLLLIPPKRSPFS
jgi:hypothetical protein